MAAMAGLFNHGLASSQSLLSRAATSNASTAASTAANGAGSSSDSSSATISSNDFLSLLVTEMQNQDPTADTDPNEYINQLVQVNSLEQLISINQNLTTALGSSATTSGSTGSSSTPATDAETSASAKAAGASLATPAANSVPAAAKTSTPGTPAAIAQFVQQTQVGQAPGNLQISSSNPAARTIAHALDGHARIRQSPHTEPGTP